MYRKNKNKYREIVLSIFIVTALFALLALVFKPSITGYTVLQESNLVGREFTSNDSIILPIKDITAIYLNSYISSNFSGEVSLYDENRRYVILDYSIPKLNEEVENASIEFELNYNKISQEVAELSVAAEQYSCVEWKINDESICYGENSCCSLLNLESSGEKNESLYLNKGRYNAQDRNIVIAQVIYANYSLDIDDAYYDIKYSDIKGVVVDLFDKLPLSNVCGGACGLNQDAQSYTLEVKVYSGSLFLENYTYQLTPNNAPEFKEVPNITFSDNYTLDLSKYLTDKDNNELNIDYLHVDGISVEFNGLTAIIKADSNFTGKAYTFFTVNDSLLSATSNIIELDVVDFKPKVVVGEDVRWVKKAPVIDNKVLLEHEPINITVKVDGEEILDRNIDIIVEGERKGLDEYEYDKKIEEMNKEIGKEIKAGRIAAPLEEEKEKFVKSKRLENTGRTLRKLISITGNVVLNEEEEENTILVINENVPEVEVEYFTEAPIAIEEEMTNGKRITVSSDISYEDVLAFAEIPDTDANSIKLYHLVNGSKVPSNFDGYDSNDNNLVDYIEWTVPHLSNQTYEIILITNADHLDENRSFVEDVYDYVKARDSNFTLIPANHYLRVKFETNLTSGRDITIYAKSNSPDASVLVYEKDKNDSTFDLRTTNDVEFDYVVDPTVCDQGDELSECNITTVKNWSGKYTFVNLRIKNGGGIVHPANGATKQFSLNITATNVTIEAGGYINVTGMGYSGGTPGVAGNGDGGGGSVGSGGDAGGGGAGYGGQGGDGKEYSGHGLNGSTYGNALEPLNLGSGGGGGADGAQWTAGTGGRGGGLVIINASDTVNVSGTILANGVTGGTSASDGGGGGGAGGSINIRSSVFTGNGALLVGGGSGGSAAGGGGGGGGGGRIAVRYSTKTFTGTTNVSGGTLGVGGGSGGGGGNNGTIYEEETGSLDVGSGITITLSNNENYNTITVSGGVLIINSTVKVNSSTVIVSGTLNMTNGSSLNTTLLNLTGGIFNNIGTGNADAIDTYVNSSATLDGKLKSIRVVVQSTGTLTHTINGNSTLYFINITATNLTIEAGGAINVKGKGHSGGSAGNGGYGDGGGGSVSSGGDAGGGGAGYGGAGGAGQTYGGTATGGSAYGNATEPLNLGSGGGGGAGGAQGTSSKGGIGGGLVIIDASSTVNVIGSILANGDSSSASSQDGSGGGGSGGSINIRST
ncbi:hypothetical protein J4401_06140, partial [Candidatus Woesearchaeota archaeon]|nr:hypothetical protein [Candidatus Woesearchaeota archaeon]